VGSTLLGRLGSWDGARPIRFAYAWRRCNAAGRRCVWIPGGTPRLLRIGAEDRGRTLRFAVRATNAGGGTWARSVAIGPVRATVPPAPGEPPPAPPPSGAYFGTEPAGAPLPHTDTACAALVTPRSWEPRPDNYPANDTVPTTAVTWSYSTGYGETFESLRDEVTGNYTGTTDEIIRWAACKWGIDEDTLRAVAVGESDWHQNAVGDNCQSFGLMQIKDQLSNGEKGFGGYPWIVRSTALNVDFYAFYLRTCLDGKLAAWLYGGVPVVGDLWGCVGSWYSGDWYGVGAQHYIAGIRGVLSARTWLSYG
jgi:hypothetical protein